MASRTIPKRTRQGVESDLKSRKYTQEEISKRRGVSRGYVSSVKAELKLKQGPLEKRTEEDLKKREDRSEIKSVKRAYEEALGKIEQLQAQVTALNQGIDLRRHYQKLEYKPKSVKRGEAVASLFLSDWHLEETVDLEAVNGVNKFDKEVRRKRLDALWPSAASLVDMCRSRSAIDTIVVHLGGDFITGWIHDELLSTNNMAPHAATFECFNELANGIRYLATELKGLRRILLPCAVGNHARLTKKKWSKDKVESSFDWLIYRFLAHWFTMNPVKGVNIQFLLPTGAMCYYDVYGMKVRVTHGDDIQYYGGSGGVRVPARKAIDGWNSTTRADYTVMGHFHEDSSDVDYRISGCLIGFSEFALKCKARFTKPSQAFEIYHPRFGVTARFPIVLPKGF